MKHDTAIAVSDKGLLARRDEKIRTLESKVLGLEAMKTDLDALSDLSGTIASGEKEREDNRLAISGLEISIDRIMKPASGKKKSATPSASGSKPTTARSKISLRARKKGTAAIVAGFPPRATADSFPDRESRLWQRP